MAANPCEEFFEKHADCDEKVKELQKLPEALAWEKISASPHSPGIVNPGEVLGRQVTHPTFYDENKQKIKPSWFDDATSRGMSTDRLAYTTTRDIADRAIARAAKWNTDNPTKPPRTFHSIGKLAVDDVRSLTFESTQAFAIYDTALKTNVAHADICLVAASKEARSLRVSLYEMAETIFVD